MIFSTFGAAALVTVTSVLIGRAIDLTGIRCREAGPAVGLSVLIIAAGIAIQLPGRAITAAVVVSLLALAALAIVVAREPRPSLNWIGPAGAAVLGAVAAAIPFIANGRVGLPGVGLDNDTASHLLWAQELRTPATAARYGGPRGYPMGPHSLVDAFSTGLGIRLDLGFTALLLAVVMVTALVAALALRRAPRIFQVTGGALAALFYLVAAYYAEGAFKEPLLGLLLLAMVLALEDARRVWIERPDRSWSLLCPVGVLVAAALYVYSYPGLSFFVLALLIWIGAEVVASRRLRTWWPRVRLAARALAAAGLVAIVLLLPIVSQLIRFARQVGVSPASTGAIAASNLGNLAHPLPGYEALGIWNSADFRFAASGPVETGGLVLALAVFAFGLARSLMRRELLLPAAVAACAALYALAAHGQSPYVAAKALVIGGPLVAVMVLRGLTVWDRVRRRSKWRGAGYLVAGVFVAAAAHSSYQALRSEPVWPSPPTDELLALAKLTRGQTVLFLGDSDYAAWMLSGSEMSTPAPTSASARAVLLDPAKPVVAGAAFDVDSVEAASLARYTWLVTTNTSYMSQVPPSFRLVRRLRMYQLWKRVGPVAPRASPDPPGAPGALINCHTPSGRRFTKQRGIAGVMAAPVGVVLTPLEPGGQEQVSLHLPAGAWQLSLQYISAVTVAVTADGHSWTMPAYQDRPGPVFAIGSVVADGRTPMTVGLHALRPSLLTGSTLGADLIYLVATRDTNRRAVVPLARTCGRYVDWYTH